MSPSKDKKLNCRIAVKKGGVMNTHAAVNLLNRILFGGLMRRMARAAF
jgi:hypothetical protein